MKDNEKIIVEKTNKINHLQHKIIKNEINSIIDEKDTNVNRIERCLDAILTNPLEEIQDLFYTLCMYYVLINEENAKFYLHKYEEYHGIKFSKIKRPPYGGKNKITN